MLGSESEEEEEDALSLDEEDLPPHLDTPTDEHSVSRAFVHECSEAAERHALKTESPDRDDEIQVEIRAATPSTADFQHGPGCIQIPQPGPRVRFPVPRIVMDSPSDVEENGSPKKATLFVLPLWAVLGSASVGLLCFLDYVRGSAPEEAFTWLVAVASVASLQSWAGMLYTYIRCVLDTYLLPSHLGF